ncbi:hypothetical protein [Nostoc sp.]|uniref:hypothetical protein n=1 Tax=Nostoc sp. TaxID=1180 RepID=UPI002FF514AC
MAEASPRVGGFHATSFKPLNPANGVAPLSSTGVSDVGASPVRVASPTGEGLAVA